MLRAINTAPEFDSDPRLQSPLRTITEDFLISQYKGSVPALLYCRIAFIPAFSIWLTSALPQSLSHPGFIVGVFGR